MESNSKTIPIIKSIPFEKKIVRHFRESNNSSGIKHFLESPGPPFGKILNLFRKEKDILFIHLAFFISDLYFDNLKQKNIIEIDKIFEIKNYIFDNLNNFHLYNINKNSLLNAVSTKLNYE